MKKNIIIVTVLLLLFLFASGIIYLNNVYLPVKVKGRLIDTLEKSLNYNVGIEKLKYNLFRGAVIENIIIYDKIKDKENTVLGIKEISFNFLYIPLIKERKIIIPVLHIDSPYLNIRYTKDNTFNISRAFSSLGRQPAKQKLKFSFLIYKINIFDGKCIFKDERVVPAFTKSIQDLDIGLTLSPLAKVLFLIEGKIQQDKEAISKLSLEGEYNLLSKEFNSKLNLANLILAEFNAYLKNLPFSISSGAIQDSNLNLKFKDNIVALKGIVYLRGLGFTKENLNLTGDINLEPELNYAMDKRRLDYKTNFKFMGASLGGIKYIDKINDITGDIGLVKDKLWTDNLELKTLDSQVTLRGTLENFLSPYLKANFTSSQFNLEKLSLLFINTQGLKVSGIAKADINIEGNLKKLPLDIKANFDISDAKLETQLLKEPINNIRGKIDLTLGGASWQNLIFNHRDTAYTSSGKVTDFKEPRINLILDSKDLNLVSDIKIKDKLIKLNSFIAKYVNSDFDIKGNIEIGDSSNPLLDLTAKLNLNLEDSLKLLPNALAENIGKIKPEGNINITGSLDGRAKNYKEWVIDSKVNSDNVSIYNLRFSNLSFDLSQKDAMLNIPRFTASGYSGAINLEFAYNFKPEVPTYALKFASSGIDLAKLKLDTGLKDKDIGGILNINADLFGDLKDWANLRGSGAFSIQNGKLWQINLLKGLGELFLLADYEKITFSEGKAEFNIKDKYILTDNLQLISDQLKLNCKGKLGFDGALDFTVYSEANKNLIRESPDIRKFTAAILGELGSAVSIKVGGTVQKPKYSIVPMPLDLIKSLRDFFLGK